MDVTIRWLSPCRRDSCVRGRGLASRPAPASAGRPPPSCPRLVSTSSYWQRYLVSCLCVGWVGIRTHWHHHFTITIPHPHWQLLTAGPWFLLPSLALFPSGSWLMRRGSSASSTRVAKSCLGTSGCSHQAVCPASFILFLLQSLLQQQQLINKGKVIYLLQAITSCFIFSFLWKPQENQNTFFGKHQILRLSWALPSNISTAFDHSCPFITLEI